jgi:hypothetical protein
VAETAYDLLTPKTPSELEAQLLAALNYWGFSVTSWIVGSPQRSYLKAIVTGEYDLSALVANIAAGNYLSTAKGPWLSLLAYEKYALARSLATRTVQLCNVTCTPGAGPVTLRKGSLVLATSGKRYEYLGDDLSVADATTDSVEFSAESPGAGYTDGPGTITQFVTSIPGLSVANPNRYVGGLDDDDHAVPNAANTGAGTVAPTASAGVLSRYYTITIVESGDTTEGSFEVAYYSTTVGGATSVETLHVSPIPASWSGSAVGDSTLTVVFADGSSSPSFAAGDSFTFWTPGSPIVVAGVDDEADEALLKRCKARWPSLSDVPTEGVVESWIRTKSAADSMGINKISISQSTTIGGQVIAVVGTPTGAPTGGQIATLQDYVSLRMGICETSDVVGATALAINPGGTVYVKSSLKATVQAAAELAWNAYIAALPIGGDISLGYPGVVRVNELQQCLMDAGAIDVIGLTLNSSASNVQLLHTEVATVGTAFRPSLSWVTVA